MYDGCSRRLCPHRLGWNKDEERRVLCYQYGGDSVSGLEEPGARSNWRCLAVEKLSDVELTSDPWHTAPNHSGRKLALCGRRWTPKIIRNQSHKTDSEPPAGGGNARSSRAAWRSNRDYAARDGREPRGRKPGGSWGAGNPRLPMRAEGEKRFRSATRNP